MKSFREFITESSDDANELKQKLEKATGFKTMASKSSFGTKIVFSGVDIPRKKMELEVGKNGLRLWVPGFNFKTTEQDEVKFFNELLKEVEHQQAKVQQRARTSKGAIKYDFEDDDHELDKLINIIDKIIANLK